MTAEIAFGITAGSRPGQDSLGHQLERLGYGELWVNDTRHGHEVRSVVEPRSRLTIVSC